MGKLKPKRFFKLFSLTIILVLIVQIVSVLILATNQANAATAVSTRDSFAWESGNEIVDQSKSVSFIKHDEFNTGLQGWALNEDPGCDILENQRVDINRFTRKSIYDEEAQKAFGGTTFSAFMIYNNAGGDDALNLRNGAVDLRLFTVTKSANSDYCQINDLGSVRPSIQNATNYFKYTDTYTIVPNNFGDRGSETNDKAFEAMKDMTFSLVDPSNTYFYDLIKQRNDISKDAVVYAESSAGDCASFIVLSSSLSGRGPSAQTTVDPSHGTLYTYSMQGNECKTGIEVTLSKPRSHTASVYKSPVAVGISNSSLFDINKAKNPESGKAIGGTTSSTSRAETCEGGIPVLGWFICSVVDLVSKFATWVDEHILKDLLAIDTSTYSKDSGLKTAWSAIRILSSVVLVGIALFIIIAQMLDLDIVGAYTLKKIIPKLVVAVILMQLSWYLGILLIDIFNVIGAAIGDLIAAPFGGAEKFSTIGAIINNYYRNAGGGSQAAAFTFVGIGVAAGFGAIGGGFGILALAITVFIAAIVAFVTLVLRKVIILALLLIAPLAIVAWILPNTQKWWKSYTDLVIKLLIMYPLVMGLLMVGRVFAGVVAKGSSGGLNDSVNFFIVILAYFGPWFFIPSMIKASGTIFAKAADGIQKAGSTATKGIRESKPMKNLEASRNYNRKMAGIQRTGSGNRFVRAFGRYQAGTMGARGAYSRQLRQAEATEALKNTSMEFDYASDGMKFSDQVEDAERIAIAAKGERVTLKNGRSVIATEAMKRTTTQWLASRNKADEVRRILEHTDATSPELGNRMRQDNAGTLLGLAPDTMGKKYEELQPETLAKMDESSWRNMSSYVADLHARGETEKVAHIKDMVNQAKTNPELSKFITFEKDQRASEITNPTSPGRKEQYKEIKLKDGTSVQTQVDYKGTTADIVDEVRQQFVVNPDFKDTQVDPSDRTKVIHRRRDEAGFDPDKVRRY